MIWTTATNSTILLQFTYVGGNGFNWIFQNFKFSNTASTRAECVDGSVSGTSVNVRFSNCSFDGFTVAIGGGYIGGIHYGVGNLILDRCEVKNSSSWGINCSGGTLIIDCYIHDNASDGVHGTLSSGGSLSGIIAIQNCVIWNNGGNGLWNDCYIINSSDNTVFQVINSVIGSNTSNGIFCNGSTGAGVNAVQGLTCINSIIMSNGGFGIINNNAAAQGTILLLNNAFMSNTSGNYSGQGMVSQPSDVLLGSSPFTNPSIGDFSLNTAPGGGTLCKGAAFPSSVP